MQRKPVLAAVGALVAACLGPGAPQAVAAECGAGTHNAEAVRSGSTWTVRNGGRTAYTGDSMLSALQAAAGSLTTGRTSKERIVVRGSDSISAGSRFSLPS